MLDVLSPYLVNTQIQYAWDSTSLGYLKTCPRLYQLTMLEGWSPRGESIHLRFGQEYHKALEDFDRLQIVGGLTRKEALYETVLLTYQRIQGWEVDQDTRAGKYKNPASLIRLIIDYIDHFNPDPAQTVVLDNGQPAVELSFRFELNWGPGQQPTGKSYDPESRQLKHTIGSQPYMLSGHLDRVVKFNGDLFVMDRKTTMTTPGSYYFDQYSPNNQMSLYTLASKVILDAPIRGVIIDAAQILVSSSAFVRGTTYRTPDQTDEWVDDLHYWFGMAESFANAGHWPMNDTACDKFGGCRFREICSKSPQVRERFLAGEFDKLAPEERWNPLKPR